MPPAYNDGAEVALLRRQLEAMADGGVVVISSPVNPARCPPAPYERASLIAHYLKTKKPKSKVIVLDAKESFTMQKLFEAAWQELYPGLIEWVGLSQGGALSSVDAATKTLSTDFDKYNAAVANIIPPQQAGRVADAGRRRRPHRLVPGRSGDVRIEAAAEHPRHRRCRHRRRDAALGLGGAFAGADLRRRHRCAARRQDAGRADAHLVVLQPDRAGLRHLAEGHLPPGRRPICRSRRRPGDQPAGCAARHARRPRRKTPTPGTAPSPARCSDEARRDRAARRCSRPAARRRARRKACVPTRSSATPSRSR